MAFNQKIAELLKEKGMTKAALAKKCGIPYTTLDSMLKRDSDNARLSQILRIAEVLGTSVEELVLDTSSAKAALPEEEKRILSLYAALDKRGRETVVSLLEKEAELAENGRKAKKRAEEGRVLREIPVFDAPAAAGAALPVLSDEKTSLLIDPAKVPSYASFGIRISGDSMEPKIHDGDLVYVKRCQEIFPGEVGIFLLNGESLCKKWERRGGEVYLCSLNPAYDPIHVLETDDLKLVGKVIASQEETV